jgi:hypothetical protein
MKLPAFTRRRAVITLHVAIVSLLCFFWLSAASSRIWPSAIDPRLHLGRTLLCLYVACGTVMAIVAQLATLAPRMFKKLSAEDTAELHFIATQCVAMSCLLFLTTDAHSF